MADEEKRSSRTAKKCAQVSSIIIKQEIRARMKQVNCILKKPVEERTSEELIILDQSPDIADAVQKRTRHRQLAKERIHEVEDPDDVLLEKCENLAEAVKNSKNLVIYTGAGISTAASIPDYRGPNGVWTLLQKGVAVKAQDLSDAEPTFTHMSITRLHQEGKVKHVVSQNCDGLHLRSGFPRHKISEVHGDMYIEICHNCKPQKEYIRLFDVTEKTGVRRHRTGRPCHVCGEGLRDTIIHFGEKAPFTSPYNWEEAAEAVDEADLILCLGSSLKVLKKYGCLWNLHKPFSKRPKLFIANLQWTPKDDSATLKINGKCDRIMEIVMSKLGYEVPPYNRLEDPIYKMATELLPHELNTTSKKILQIHKCLEPPVDVKITTEKCQTKEEPISTSAETCSTSGTGIYSDVDVKLESNPYVETVTGGCHDLDASKNLDMIKALLRAQIIQKSSPVNATGDTLGQTTSALTMDRQITHLVTPGQPSTSSSTSSLISGNLMIRPSTMTISQPSLTSVCAPSLMSSSVVVSSTGQYTSPDHALCSSELMNSLSHQAHLTAEMTANDKPSDKYKLIKYLLNKPADVTDEKLKQFTEKLRNICDSATLGELASECQSRLIYTTADSFKYKPAGVVPTESQGGNDKTESAAPLSKSYPTLIGALRGFVQHDGKYVPSAGATSTLFALPNPATQKSLGFPASTTGAQNLGPLSIDVGAAAGMAAFGNQEGLVESGLLKTAIGSSGVQTLREPTPAGSAGLRSEGQTSLLAAHHQMKRNASIVENDPQDSEQAENISPAHLGSAPGWFGKGLNIKKRRKKSR